MRERDLIVINLWLAVFIQVAAISAYSPFVPSMREELNFSFSEFGLLSTLFYLPYMMLQLFSGRASDRGQARTLLLIGIPILMILTMLLGAVENIAEALALRTVSGIFGAMIFVPALSVITKLDNKGLNTAIATLGTSVGAGSLYVSLLGPQLAVFLGWRLGIATMMLPGFAIWILNAKFIPKIRGGDFEKAASVPTRLSFKRKETWLLG
ncbi:MAG: MFS transporter, partial [Nitrososphaerales archaeon]